MYKIAYKLHLWKDRSQKEDAHNPVGNHLRSCFLSVSRFERTVAEHTSAAAASSSCVISSSVSVAAISRQAAATPAGFRPLERPVSAARSAI